jgi:hypothetical protein
VTVLVASVAEFDGLGAEDPLGSGYLAAHLAAVTDVQQAGFVDVAGFEAAVAATRPTLAMLGCFTPASAAILRILDAAADAGLPVVVGGPAYSAPHATPLIDHPAVVRVVFGEADAIGVEALIEGAPHESVWARSGPAPTRPAALERVDEAPVPLRPNLRSGATSRARVSTARGCPFGCRYCPVPIARRLSGQGWRPRGAGSLRDEVGRVVAAGASHISLADESATGTQGMARMGELADVLAPFPVTWSAMLSPLAIRDLDPMMAAAWAATGLSTLYMLLNDQTGFRDHQLAADAQQVADRLRAAGIGIEPGIITVDPYLRPEEMMRRLGAVAALVPASPEAYVRPLQLHPGTPEIDVYRRAAPVAESGPLARAHGVTFRFVHPETPSILEGVLEVLDAGWSEPADDLAAAVARHLGRFEAMGAIG